MRERNWQIGVCGTFDVANYGDLLFPLIAEAELTARLGPLTLHRFSYGDKTSQEWPYEVSSVAKLPAMIRHLDGLLIGGGFLIRFDKWVVPGYAPPPPDDVHHPTGYWLTPALLALQHDVPVVWNAPGMNGNEIPRWAHPLMEPVLALSRYVSVRDEPSAASLEDLGGDIHVVPDTAFRISGLMDLERQPSPEFARLSRAADLDGPYIVVQAAWGMESVVRFLKRHARQLGGFRFVALPVSPVLGDDAALIDADLPGLARLPEWPSPLVVAELIARSEAVVGHSYHLFISALASGVPVFASPWMSSGRIAALRQGRFTALQNFDTIFPLPADGEPDPHWFLSRVGRRAPLCEHWDRIAAALRMDAPPNTSIALNRFWQLLPALLEDAHLEHVAALGALETEKADGHARLQQTLAELTAARAGAAETQAQLEGALKRLAAAQAEADARDRSVAEIMTSTSWRLTAPVRFVGRRLRRRNREDT